LYLLQHKHRYKCRNFWLWW